MVHTQCETAALAESFMKCWKTHVTASSCIPLEEHAVLRLCQNIRINVGSGSLNTAVLICISIRSVHCAVFLEISPLNSRDLPPEGGSYSGSLWISAYLQASGFPLLLLLYYVHWLCRTQNGFFVSAFPARRFRPLRWLTPRWRYFLLWLLFHFFTWWMGRFLGYPSQKYR